ncbi:sulfurtransferase [Sulfoacidibacillus ferrooxidans]|uniref:sulfurtransferase n=1 Tax=Sulfoacidibacillus ferrooxidans TaxID=2005001 RepID=UPI001F512D26
MFITHEKRLMTVQEVFVTNDWLHKHMDDQDLVIVDCRATLGKPHAGYMAYQEGHIPGAIFADLEVDLSSDVEEHGGRHPLPETAKFSSWLIEHDITPEKTVIAYDEKGDMAPHLWWLLRYFGHDNVSVLIGGMANWISAGLPLATGIELKQTVTEERSFDQTAFEVYRPHPEMIVSRDELMKHVTNQGTAIQLIDARALKRYRGEIEPIDPVAGHIPTAICYPWEETVPLYEADDPKVAMAHHFSAIKKGSEVVVYCGSGVSACADILALHVAGIEAKLYPGSWSDWCSFEDSPIARG